jgi:hypothetical protein
MNSRPLALNVLLLGVVVAAGCKSSTGTVTGEVHGKVTFKGQPVKHGTITFYHSATGQPAEAKLEEDGSYVIKTPLEVGEYLVWITPPMHLVDSEPGKTPAALEAKDVPDIPYRYRDKETSPLKTTISEGKNEANFDMVP